MPGDCVKQVCRECARSTAGGFDSRTVCDHYQLIREQVSPFPVSDPVHASAQNQGITAPNALWHELQKAGRPSGRSICHPLPPHHPPSFSCFYNKDSLSYPHYKLSVSRLVPDMPDSPSSRVCDPLGLRLLDCTTIDL